MITATLTPPRRRPAFVDPSPLLAALTGSTRPLWCCWCSVEDARVLLSELDADGAAFVSVRVDGERGSYCRLVIFMGRRPAGWSVERLTPDDAVRLAHLWLRHRGPHEVETSAGWGCPLLPVREDAHEA